MTTLPLRRPFAAAIALVAASTLLNACASNNKPPPRAERVAVQPRAVPAQLRGTIGSFAQSTAGEPLLVSGFGLVVGLNGTGGGVLDERIAVTMERQMALQGIGKAGNFEGT